MVVSAKSERPIGLWLIGIAGLIFLMVLVGGITRLTDSGLSITEWDPIMGAIPPMTEEGWREAFEKYQEIPEYKYQNKGMSLEAFKGIFFWEWFHRLLGRLIGVAFAVPLVWFAVTKRISRALLPKLIGIFVLGGLQGGLGWYMVMSGLVDRVDVSQYRLTAHLGVAVAIYCACLWVAFGILFEERRHRLAPSAGLFRLVAGLVVLVFGQILLGGFVAGLDAGIGYNTWPLMEGDFIPPHLYASDPCYLSSFEDPLSVQFNHRMVAYLVSLYVLGLTLWIFADQHLTSHRPMVLSVLSVVVLQVVLGILTLVHVVPISLAALHQGGALVVLAVSLYWMFLTRAKASLVH
ncbi:MAG: heme A synthase [Alphaproteobacteria bacterium]|nr:MAG: heme A synthase [Alphaproteobacteria bacterium]